jgi:predicted DNA-binding transcriptional regulator AlpA
MQSQWEIDDALIGRFLGTRYIGRRYLRYSELEALGLVDNRGSLKNWIDAGAFPRGIKIPGRTGKTLVWHAVEVARHIAQRVAARESASPDDESAPSRERSSDSDDPFAPGRNEFKAPCPYPTTET